MIAYARAAGLAAALMLVAAPRAEAQVSTIRVTISGGPHAGTYTLERGQCDALDGQVISMFTPRLAGVAQGPKVPESIEALIRARLDALPPDLPADTAAVASNEPARCDSFLGCLRDRWSRTR